MNKSSEDIKQELLDQVGQALSSRISVRQAGIARDYLAMYFRRVPLEEMSRENPQVLASIVVAQLQFLKVRLPGESLIRVFNPTRDTVGWDGDHTIIEMVNDDKPFLVDSATLALSELNLDVHLIIHPVIRVRRDKNGQISAVTHRDDKKAIAESVVQIQINRQTDPDILEEIEARLLTALGDVDLAVRDWQAMSGVVEDTIENLPSWAPGADAELMSECQAFMSWLKDDHFILLGVRDYEVVKGNKVYEGHIVPGTGLGILSVNEQTVMRRPLTDIAEESRKNRHEMPLIITKTNARSTVHRVGYLDYIGVLTFDARGQTIAERRFLGLFTSSAYSLSVMETPVIRRRANQLQRR
jgi:glutamate dehydrogenase